jgi:hypothetical protein
MKMSDLNSSQAPRGMRLFSGDRGVMGSLSKHVLLGFRAQGYPIRRLFLRWLTVLRTIFEGFDKQKCHP